MTIRASVIIPTYKRPAFLLDALQSLLTQQAIPQYEVLVLDNACDPALHVRVESLAQSVSVPLAYVPVHEPGLHNGRHTGATIAKGEILVFVDDDIIADKDWLQAVVDTFEVQDVHLVGGKILPLYEEPPPEWLEALWTKSNGKRWCGYLTLLDFGDQVVEMDPGFVWGANFAIRKKTLVELGGFCPDGMPWELRRYRGDGESAVTRKAQALGLKAVYRPDALVYHRVPKSRLTVEYFERRAFLQGISDSFTAIRAHGRLPPAATHPASLDWKTPLRWAKRSLRRLLRPAPAPPPPDPYREIRDRVRAAYEAGYRYHQEEVRNDPTLLEWVLRPDYWDAAVPRQPEKGAM